MLNMTERASRLLAQLLELSEGEKADVVSALLSSLDGPADSRSAEAWREEILRRFDGVMNGEPTVPWAQVRAEAEERLRRPRG